MIPRRPAMSGVWTKGAGGVGGRGSRTIQNASQALIWIGTSPYHNYVSVRKGSSGGGCWRSTRSPGRCDMGRRGERWVGAGAAGEGRRRGGRGAGWRQPVRCVPGASGAPWWGAGRFLARFWRSRGAAIWGPVAVRHIVGWGGLRAGRAPARRRSILGSLSGRWALALHRAPVGPSKWWRTLVTGWVLGRGLRLHERRDAMRWLLMILLLFLGVW